MVIEMVVPLIVQFMTIVLFPVMAAYLISAARAYGIKTAIESKEALVVDTVFYIERVYDHLDGRTKYVKALEHATMWLKRYGLKIKTHELEELIDAFVEELRLEWEK